MVYRTRENPLFSACGLNCGLCPRYHTEGASRCPGCAGEGFSAKHPACGALSCSQRNGLEYCFLCDEYPCKKYEGADLSDSFITHKHQLLDADKAKSMGLEAYEAELNRKVEILKRLLEHYDDGRRKSFFCVAVNLLPLQDATSVMARIADESAADAPLKEKAATAVRLFEEAADGKGISLRLRKKAAQK